MSGAPGAARIASLIPSGTDLVAALGLTDRLVGVSHECDDPAARGLPVLTASTLTEGMAPADVDAAVSASVADGISLYRTDRAELHRLAPDVVLSQDVCDVCAVNGEVARGDVPDGSQLVMLTAVRLADLWDDVRRVARAAGVDDRGDQVVAQAQAELAAVREAVAERPTRRVVALDWGDPPFAAGHWIPDLVALGGGVDALGGEVMSRRVSWDDVAAAQPDVVVFLPCGYGLDQAVAEAATLPLAGLGAEVWTCDATSLFSRCTPGSVVAGAQAMAAMLHPGAVAVPEGQIRQIHPAAPAGS